MCTLEYARGKMISDGMIVEDLDKDYRGYTGTTVTFIPDEGIFVELDSFLQPAEFFEDLLRTRVFLSSRLHADDDGKFREVSCRLNFNDEVIDIYEPEGIVGLLKRGVGESKVYHAEPFFIDAVGQDSFKDPDTNEKRSFDVRFQIALQFSIEPGTRRYFCNTIEQENGGTHANGILQAVYKVLSEEVIAAPFVKERDKAMKLTTEDTSDFLNVALSLFHPEPIYKGQAKYVLQNRNVRSIIMNAVVPEFTSWLRALDATEYRRIIERVVANARARAESKKMKDTHTKIDMGLMSLNNIGKFVDARHSDRTKCEVFVCEG